MNIYDIVEAAIVMIIVSIALTPVMGVLIGSFVLLKKIKAAQKAAKKDNTIVVDKED